MITETDYTDYPETEQKMEITKKEKYLIVITVILVLILAFGFYYDRNSALIDRTNHIAFSKDANLKLEKINKAGFLYARQSYEAKFRILDNNWENYFNAISKEYGAGGGLCGIDGYKLFETEALSKNTIKPQPKADAMVWILGVPIDNKTKQNVVYITDTEGDGNSYLYIYYSRK